MSLACGGGAAARAGARAPAARRRRAPAAPAAPAPPAAPLGRLRTVSVRAAWRQTAAASGRGLALSLFHRFRGGLPPEGQLLPPDEQMCDPYLENCKTPLHVHESACPSCGGCGWARAPPRARCPHGHGHRGGQHRHSFRGGLHECLACHGLGYTRTATVEPPPLTTTYLTLARPAEADPRAVSAARLRAVLRGTKAADREAMAVAAGAAGGGGGGEEQAGAAAAAAAAASQQLQQQQAQQQQQQRQREREAAIGSLDRAAFWRGVQARWQQGAEGDAPPPGGGGAGSGAKSPLPPRGASPAPAK